MPRPPVGHRRNLPATVARYVALVVAAVVFLLPFYLIVRNGLATQRDISAPGWTLLPATLHWENITQLFDNREIPFARSLWNSTVVSVLQTGGQLLVCSLAGYGLARIPYRHANKVLYTIIGTLMIPTAVTFVPTFVVVSSLGWISDPRGLIIPGLFSAFTTFLFRQYFLGFPRELEEAGRVDGLGRLGVFARIVVPNSLGFFAAIGVIDFITSWNAFLWPLVISQDSGSWTVQVALSNFLQSQNPRIHLLFAAAAISILPLLAVFVLLQRYLVKGVAETGIKG